MAQSIQRHPFGTTGIQVSAIGFGAAEIGFASIPNRTVDRLIGLASDAGINVIDTASMYRDSEEKIGRALQGRRSQFFLFTKCGLNPPSKLSSTGFFLRVQKKISRQVESSSGSEFLCWHPRTLQCNIEQSLRRLKTDCIDLIQLHSCTEEVLRQGDAIDVLQRLRKSGKVCFLGYSSDGCASNYAIQCGQFHALQLAINIIADQDPLDATVPSANQHRMGVIAKRPIANGLWRESGKPQTFHNQAYWERLRKLHYPFLNTDHAVETALRFTLSAEGIHTVLIGTTNPEHLQEDIAYAASGPLEPQEFQEIRAKWKKIAEPDWRNQV